MGSTAADRKEPGAIYWEAIGPYCDVIDIYGSPARYLKSLVTIPPWCIHLIAVHWTDSELCNGGFHQFFHNSTGMLAPEALGGFQALNLKLFEDVVRRAMLRFGDPYPRGRADRWERLARLELDGCLHDNSKVFEDLDERYYAVEEQSDLSTLMDVYARDHTV